MVRDVNILKVTGPISKMSVDEQKRRLFKAIEKEKKYNSIEFLADKKWDSFLDEFENDLEENNERLEKLLNSLNDLKQEEEQGLKEKVPDEQDEKSIQYFSNGSDDEGKDKLKQELENFKQELLKEKEVFAKISRPKSKGLRKK